MSEKTDPQVLQPMISIQLLSNCPTQTNLESFGFAIWSPNASIGVTCVCLGFGIVDLGT